jgi:hypothetical protein
MLFEERSMNRRDFLQTAGTVGGILASKGPSLLLAGNTGWRTFEVTTQVEVLKPSGTTRVWLPEALVSTTPFQRTRANTIRCENGVARTVVNKTDGLGIVTVEFPPGVKPILALTSRVATRDWAIDFTTRGKAPKADAAELRYYLRPTRLLPTDGIVKETADEITRNLHLRTRPPLGDATARCATGHMGSPVGNGKRICFVAQHDRLAHSGSTTSAPAVAPTAQ